MYPAVPYKRYSWQITQHAGIIKDDVIWGMLQACAALEGKVVTSSDVDVKIAEQGILDSSTGRGIWRDYQQIMYELGFVYATSATGNEMRPTPIAYEILRGNLTFGEALTFQMLRYQYPNGYKNTIPKAVADQIPETEGPYESLIELQEHYDVRIRPLAFTWLVFTAVEKELGVKISLTADEILDYLMPCASHDDFEKCKEALVRHEKGESHLPVNGESVRRNAQDWMKLFCLTGLFDEDSAGRAISLSSVSREYEDELRWLCEMLSDPSGFWTNDEQGGASWYEFYGAVESPLRTLVTDNAHDFGRIFPSVVATYLVYDYKLFSRTKEAV